MIFPRILYLIPSSERPTYFYSTGYVFVGPHKNEPIKTGDKLTVSSTDKFAPASTARVPKFDPAPQGEQERLARVYHDRLVVCSRKPRKECE